MEFSVKRLSFEINVDLRDGHPLKMSGKISGYHLRFANRNAASLGKASCCAFLWGHLPEYVLECVVKVYHQLFSMGKVFWYMCFKATKWLKEKNEVFQIDIFPADF